MSTKLTLTEAVSVIPVSESTLRRDLKSGKVSFDTDERGRKRIDVSELTRVYGPLKPQPEAEPVNDTPENPSMNGNETPTLPFLTENDNSKVIALLEGQVQDLKAQLADEKSEKSELLTLAKNLQKQNEVLMLPRTDAPQGDPGFPRPSEPPREKSGWVSRLKNVFNTRRKESENA